MYTTSFTVVGDSAFPLDMLRYDGCYPETSDDVNEMCDSLEPIARRDRREARAVIHQPTEKKPEPTLPLFAVRLVTCHSQKQAHITDARWESFQWMVLRQPANRMASGAISRGIETRKAGT